MLLLAGLAGCVASSGESGWKPVRQQRRFLVHVVQWQKETLPMIAQWYTGNRQNWKKLAAANPNIVADHLVAGDSILLPPHLLKTEKPMPREFISEFSPPPPRPKPAPAPQKSQPSAPEEDDFELFGPK